MTLNASSIFLNALNIYLYGKAYADIAYEVFKPSLHAMIPAVPGYAWYGLLLAIFYGAFNLSNSIQGYLFEEFESFGDPNGWDQLYKNMFYSIGWSIIIWDLLPLVYDSFILQEILFFAAPIGIFVIMPFVSEGLKFVLSFIWPLIFASAENGLPTEPAPAPWPLGVKATATMTNGTQRVLHSAYDFSLLKHFIAREERLLPSGNPEEHFRITFSKPDGQDVQRPELL